MKSEAEETVLWLCRQFGLGEPEREYRFHADRKWRFDFAYPSTKVAIEVEGGTWKKSRHTTARGYEADAEKYNAAQILGWKVLRYTTDVVKKNPTRIVDDVRQAMNNRTVK